MSQSPSDLDKLSELLKKFRFAMLTTRTDDGKLAAHPLTVQEAEFDRDLWFIIGKNASAVEDVARDPNVGISLSSNDAWVSLAGTASVVSDPEKLRELWNPAVEAWFSGRAREPERHPAQGRCRER